MAPLEYAAPSWPPRSLDAAAEAGLTGLSASISSLLLKAARRLSVRLTPRAQARSDEESPHSVCHRGGVRKELVSTKEFEAASPLVVLGDELPDG